MNAPEGGNMWVRLGGFAASAACISACVVIELYGRLDRARKGHKHD